MPPARKIRLSKLLPDSAYTQIWFFYPFLTLAAIAAGLYYGATFLLDKDELDRKEQFVAQQLDLKAEDAIETVMARYNEANGGLQSLEYLLKSKELVFSGLLETENQRYLFKSTVQPMRSLNVHFISENQAFDFKLTPRLDPLTEFVPTKEMQELKYLATVIAELTGYSVNPLHSASIYPEYLSLGNLHRTHRSGTPALAINVLCQTDPAYQATLYINERDMRAFALDTKLGTGKLRSYHFRYSAKPAEEAYPETVRLISPSGKDWIFYFNRIKASYASKE